MLKPLPHLVAVGLLYCLLGLGLVRSQDATSSIGTKPDAQGYLYVQPFGARVEVLIRAPLILQWLDMPMDAAAAVTTEDQEKIRTATSQMVADWCAVSVDGVAMKGTLTTVAFYKGALTKSVGILPADALSAKDLLIGLVWEFLLPAGPEQIDVRWTKFLPPLEVIPMQVNFGRETEAQELYIKLPVIHWINKGRLPHPRPPALVPSYVDTTFIPIPVAFILAMILGFIVHGWMNYHGKKYPGGFMPFFMAWVFGLFISANMFVVSVPNPASPKAVPITTKEQAEAIVTPLLHNLYRAFDVTNEAAVRDVLQRSVDGTILDKIYKDTDQALKLAGPEGIRVQVTELAVTIEKVEASGRGFIAEAEWSILGKRSHWGHPDVLASRYKARLSVQPKDGVWKIKNMQVLEAHKS
jgi:hypothetical protein